MKSKPSPDDRADPNETSSHSPPAPSSSLAPAPSSFSLDKSRQYISALSILAVALFIGLPVWWKTTEVYRCPLPYKEINELSVNQVPSEITFRITISYLGNRKLQDHTLNSFASQAQKELVNSSAVGSRNIRIRIHYAVEAQPLSADIESQLTSVLQQSAMQEFSSVVNKVLSSSLGHYTILLVSKDLLPKEGTSALGGDSSAVYVSQYRHAIIGTDSELASSLPALLKVVKLVYSERKQLEKILKSTSIRQQDRVDIESMRQLRATQGYHIAITLLNPNPSQLNTSWNIQEATRSILLPFLQHPGIANLGNFTVSSQVFYYTDVKFRAKKEKDKESYYVLSSQLPPMISSVESKLASHVSQLPSLNFLVYIPKPSEYPLHIRQSSKSNESTNTFLVAQWGGVMIYNPPEIAQQRESASKEGKGTGGESETSLLDSKGALKVAVRMENVIPIFIQQLKMLLGVSSSEWPQGTDKVNFIYTNGRLGITDWQVDRLLVSKMVESISMATTSLISLVQLLDKVKNMVISDHIQQEVEASLQCILRCYELASEGSLGEAYIQAKRAMHSAETAFFDPSILELLYFPDDQKFAIYIPLFLPISVPILLSSIAALKWLAAGLKSRNIGTNSKTMSKKSGTQVTEQLTDSSSKSLSTASKDKVE